jgi:hypothetical protein
LGAVEGGFFAKDLDQGAKVQKHGGRGVCGGGLARGFLQKGCRGDRVLVGAEAVLKIDEAD